MPSRATRTAGDVIAEAFRKNRFAEVLLYIFTVVTFFAGIAVLVVGAYKGEGVTATMGTAASVMFYPAMRLAKKIREQNLAIMLLEIPLSNAKTAEEAASVLRSFFESTFPGKKG
jgi:hypothetical protein